MPFASNKLQNLLFLEFILRNDLYFWIDVHFKRYKLSTTTLLYASDDNPDTDIKRKYLVWWFSHLFF